MINEEKDIIEVYKKNESTLVLVPNSHSLNESLYQYFKYKKPGFVKNRFTRWDGMVRLMNKNNGELPVGLLPMLASLAQKRDYELILDEEIENNSVNDVTSEAVDEFIESLHLPKEIDPYDYQRKAVYYGIMLNRYVAHAATSAGKSLIIYMLTRYAQLLGDKKILIMVPSIDLVEQMYNDFGSYSKFDNWDVDDNCHRISASYVKTTDLPVIISTWQSLQNMKASYFEQFDAVFADECHLCKADVQTKILKHCINASIRIGFSGSIQMNDQTGYHPASIQASFGPIINIVSSKELRDSGRATDTHIDIIKFEYPEDERKDVSNFCDYFEEMNYLVEHPRRTKTIATLASSLKGNTLILSASLDHIQHLCDEISKSKKCFMINGQVSKEDRAEIRKIIERGDDLVLVASYGTTSTGVSIKKLHNLIFAYPTKSYVRAIQSLGRMMRLHKSKNIANIYDIVDDLTRRNVDYINYAYKHGLARISHYKDQEHDYNIHEINI